MTDETKGTPLTERLRKVSRHDAVEWVDICWEAAAELNRLTALVATEKERADKAERDAERLRQHALKYVDPLLGSEQMVKDAEDWIDNRLARHGEGHHALAGIYPCDMGMLANALKSFRLRLYKSEAALLSERELVKELRRALDEAAKAVPTNWLDPLLIGPDAVLPKDGAYNPRHIEALLRGVRDRICALALARSSSTSGTAKDD
jgi:hypothetical protein